MLQLIQPKQRAKRADRKDLAIVRMSAQLQIISCRRVLRQLQRPVIQQDMTDIFISHQLLRRGPRSLSMGAVISADQHDIIPQEHPLIASDLDALPGDRAFQLLLAVCRLIRIAGTVVIAIDVVDAQAAAQLSQLIERFFHLCG